MTHDELLACASAKALGALDGDERAEFEAHLPTCAACRAELASYREVAGLLALAAPAARAQDPAALRARVLRDARGAGTQARQDVRDIGLARSARGPMRNASWLAIAASLVIAAATGSAWLRERSILERLSSRLASTQADLARADSLVNAFMGPEVHVVSLSQADRKPSMRVYWNHTRQIYIVTAFNLPKPPSGKTYQLWAMQNGKAPQSMGTFTTDQTGRGTKIFAVAPSIIGAGFIDNCGLTLEPEGGSPQPTEAPRLIGAWRHVD